MQEDCLFSLFSLALFSQRDDHYFLVTSQIFFELPVLEFCLPGAWAGKSADCAIKARGVLENVTGTDSGFNLPCIEVICLSKVLNSSRQRFIIKHIKPVFLIFVTTPCTIAGCTDPCVLSAKGPVLGGFFAAVTEYISSHSTTVG
jgi:hypothetical protein